MKVPSSADGFLSLPFRLSIFLLLFVAALPNFGLCKPEHSPYETVLIDDPAEKSAGIYFRISQRGQSHLLMKRGGRGRLSRSVGKAGGRTDPGLSLVNLALFGPKKVIIFWVLPPGASPILFLFTFVMTNIN